MFYAKEGVSRLFVQNFLSLSTEKIRWGTLRCIRKFQVSKNSMHQRGGRLSRLSVENFFSHSIEKFRWRTLRCFRKFRVWQNFMHKKGISPNTIEKFLSHSADKIRRTLLYFERILVSKIFKQRRGKLHGFVENILSHRTEKTSPGNHSVFHKISGREKNFMDKRGGSITIFRRKVFISLYQNISLENTLVFQKNSFIENFHA